MKKILTILSYMILVAIALSMLGPFLWMISSSFMTEMEAKQFPPKFIPRALLWNNYKEALTLQPFDRYFLNSIVVSSATVAGQMLFCSMAGFAFARLRFPHRNKFFAVYLGTMMIPAIVTIIPAFLMINMFGWMNTYWALFTAALSSVWGIFLMRQFFQTIPRELEDAARVDGASEFTIYWRVVLPLSKPALATLGIFSFMGSWKDFLWPLLVTNKQSMRTLEIGIASFNSQYATNWPYQMAAAVVVMLPLVIVFLFAQKHFIKGITMTGMKG